jgi:uncharacterized phage-associated protein
MPGPVNVLSAARRMCERSGWQRTNLELQKMLYLAQMAFMGEHDGARLMDETFEAWDYGPVSPIVYRAVRSFGSSPIRNVFFGVPLLDEGERQGALDRFYDQLSKFSSSRLVSITHWDRGAWAKNYIPGVRGIPIEDSDILDEYSARVQDQKERREATAANA